MLKEKYVWLYFGVENVKLVGEKEVEKVVKNVEIVDYLIFCFGKRGSQGKKYFAKNSFENIFWKKSLSKRWKFSNLISRIVSKILLSGWREFKQFN